MPTDTSFFEEKNPFPPLRITKKEYENKLSEKIEFGRSLLRKTELPSETTDRLIAHRKLWEKSISVLIDRAFEDNSIHYTDFMNRGSNRMLNTELLRNAKTNREAKLIEERYEISKTLNWLHTHKGAIVLFEESQTVVIFSNEENTIPKQSDISKMVNNKCFIIHGHDETQKYKISRFITERLKKETIILHEQPSRGKAIIEKFEKHSNVDFAIAIWTADDIGKANVEKDYKPRARQNVVLETGYFVGKLGREKVIILREKGVEIPSDFLGVIYIDLEGGWEEKLRQEIEAIYESI